jgi:hypothetical protein
MKKTIFLLAIILLSTITMSYAQKNKKKQKIEKPVFTKSITKEDEWVEFQNLPYSIVTHIDPLLFKNALKIDEDSCYLVETYSNIGKDGKHKGREVTQTQYSFAGEIIDISYFRTGISPVGIGAIVGIAGFFVMILSGGFGY